jgi:HAD superfamily hydrolase (TIGR01509 family)
VTLAEAVAFDLDGTLIDTAPAHGEAYRLAFSELGIEIGAGDFAQHVGLHHMQIIQLLAGDHANEVDATSLHGRKSEHYEAVAPQLCRPLPLLSLVAMLHGQTPLALVTSATRRTACASLAGIWDINDFDVVVTADDVAKHKPDPAPFLLSAQLLGVPPGRVLVFEDSGSGIEAATRAGCLVAPVGQFE